MTPPPLAHVLDAVPKAQLQGFYLHWFPGQDLLSSKERLRTELADAMADHHKVRERFDSLNRSQRSFLSALLMRGETFTGTIDEIRGAKHGRSLEDYEIESLTKSLQESGYVIRSSAENGSSEVFSIPGELGRALRSTIALEERSAPDLLTSGRDGDAEDVERQLAKLDGGLRDVVQRAIEMHGGIMTRSLLTDDDGQEHGQLLASGQWRSALEAASVGTTGVLSLKNFGIEIEEDALIVDQAVVATVRLSQATDYEQVEIDREISLGSDLFVDISRLPVLFDGETATLTREGRVYKKIEDRFCTIAGDCAEFRPHRRHSCSVSRRPMSTHEALPA